MLSLEFVRGTSLDQGTASNFWLLVELGMKPTEESLGLMPKFLSFLKHDDPVVVRHSDATGTRLFFALLDETTHQKMSSQSSKNRSMSTMPHRTGSKPFRDIIYGMKRGNLLVDEPSIDKYDEMSKLKESQPGMSDGQLIEKCFGPQSHGHVARFGGGVKRKNLMGSKRTRKKVLLDVISQKEEDNKKLQAKILDLDEKVKFLMDNMPQTSNKCDPSGQ